MIPYEDLVAALDEVNGRVSAAAKPASKKRETGSVRAASAPQAAAYPEQSTVAADISDLIEEPSAPVQDPVRDISLVTAEPDLDMMPLATAEPEAQESFEVLTEEPLPPPPPEQDASDFDILSESELPLPPPPASEKQSQMDEVLGDNAFSNFFESAQNENAGVELFDAPTPPPEDSDDELLPPPPEDWK